MTALNTVVETNGYLKAADNAGVSADERTAIVNRLAANPAAGDVMPGCGGARKLRVAKHGGGKSGGYRLITYFGGATHPVFLLELFAKGTKLTLTMAERNALASLTRRLEDGR